MDHTLFKARTHSSSETRSAYAGESLYALLQRTNNVVSAVNSMQIAMENHSFSDKEQKVIWSSLQLLNHNDSSALEDYDEGFEPSMGDRVKNTLSSILTSAKEQIVKVGEYLKEELQDFYDARLNWYGSLDKEIQKLSEKRDLLDGNHFVNTAMVKELQRKKSNKTYPTPVHRISVVKQEAMKALMVADLIKNQSATVAKALLSTDRSLERSVNELIETIRSTSHQSGDECYWVWNSFSTKTIADLSRGVVYSNMGVDDFNPKKIQVHSAEDPCVGDRLMRADPEALNVAGRYAQAAQKTIEIAIEKNDNDLWSVMANIHVSEEDTFDDEKVNSVKSLILFADRIHEYIAKSAQQSFFDSVYTVVKWIDLSIKDVQRSQSRQSSHYQE